MYWGKLTEVICLWYANVIYEPYFYFHWSWASIWDKALRHSSVNELYLRQPQYEKWWRDLDTYLHPWYFWAIYPPYLHKIFHRELRHLNSLHRPKLFLRMQRSLRRDFISHPWQRQRKGHGDEISDPYCDPKCIKQAELIWLFSAAVKAVDDNRLGWQMHYPNVHPVQYEGAVDGDYKEQYFRLIHHL